MPEVSFPEIQHLGKLDVSKSEKIRKIIAQTHEQGARLTSHELIPTPELEKIRSEANAAITHHIAKKYGLSGFEVPPPDRVHFMNEDAPYLDKDSWGEIEGYHSVSTRAIYVRTDTEDIDQIRDGIESELERSDDWMYAAEILADNKYGEDNEFDYQYSELDWPPLEEYIQPDDTEEVKKAKTRAYEKHLLFKSHENKNDEDAAEAYRRWKIRRISHIYIHEAYHFGSKNKLLLINEAFGSRSGYNIQSPKDTNEYLTSFTSLNEAVTEQLAVETLNQNEERLNVEPLTYYYYYQVEDLRKDYTEDDKRFYELDRILLNIVIGVISERLKKPEEKIWSEIVLGYISGEMMHLRDIEKVYGPSSLRLYASLPPISDLPQKLRDEIYDFFKNPNPNKVKSLAEQVAKETTEHYHANKISRKIGSSKLDT
jgi:hypothetical protein